MNYLLVCQSRGFANYGGSWGISGHVKQIELLAHSRSSEDNFFFIGTQWSHNIQKRILRKNCTKIDLPLLKKANSRLSLLICSKRNSNTQFSFCCSSIKIMSSNFERKHPILPESRKYQIKALKFFKLDFSWSSRAIVVMRVILLTKRNCHRIQENILYALKTRFSNLD